MGIHQYRIFSQTMFKTGAKVMTHEIWISLKLFVLWSCVQNDPKIEPLMNKIKNVYHWQI